MLALSGLLPALIGDWRIWGICALIVGGLVVFVQRSLAQRRLAFSDYDKKAIADIYLDLRRQALAYQATDPAVGPVGPHGAYGVVMDWGHLAALVTVTSFNSGDASIYLSTGGGWLGGGAHPRVRDAARAFVAEAEKRLAAMPQVTEFPLPKIGYARFYVLTQRGVFGTLVRIAPPEANFASLWSAGQEVVTAIRETQLQAQADSHSPPT